MMFSEVSLVGGLKAPGTGTARRRDGVSSRFSLLVQYAIDERF